MRAKVASHRGSLPIVAAIRLNTLKNDHQGVCLSRPGATRNYPPFRARFPDIPTGKLATRTIASLNKGICTGNEAGQPTNSAARITWRGPEVTLPGRGNEWAWETKSPSHRLSRARLTGRVSLVTAMVNSEDTAPQFSTYPYSWAPDCGVTLDDFLKKVCTRRSLTNTIIGAQWSTETLNGRGRRNQTGES